MAGSLLGRTIGKYEIVDVIGHGGMASIYLGYQKDLDRKVAIKVLPPHPGLDAQFIERFQLEARTVAKLQHPHILPLYDFGIDDNVLYLVTPYVDGGSLDRMLEDGRLDILYAERILREIASALDFAHRRGVIHRDIKPGNILLDSEGRTLLADFGIAKMADSSANLTGTGVIGTPAYMSPEQGQGAPLDARADIYSLGVLVYEMLTGRHPFVAENPMQVILQHIQNPVTPLTVYVQDLPAALDLVITKVLAKRPEDRYQSAVAFAEAFSSALHKGEALDAIRRAMPLTLANTGKLSGAEIANIEEQTKTKILPTTQIPTPAGESRGWMPFALGVVGLILFLGLGGLFLTSQTQQAATSTPTSPVVISATSVPNFGQLSFSTVSAPGDTAAIQLNNVRPPANGHVYVAWLADTRSETTLNIGRIPVDAAGNGAASFQSPDGQMLPAFYNAVYISEEPVSDLATAMPSGEILYRSVIPIEISDMLREIFVTSESGLNGLGLLDTAISEATVGAEHAGLAAGADNVPGMRLHIEHTLNILLGEQEDHDGNGRGQNPGAGIGLYPMLDAMDELLRTATSVEGVGIRAQSEAESIRVCLDNVRGWADEVIELERASLTAESLEAASEDQTRTSTVAPQLVAGVDLNGVNGIEPFEGECGLQQIPANGLLVATMDVIEGD